jgi:hypothetical protein
VGFQLHDVAERQLAGDAVGDAVWGAERVAHRVAETEAALHVSDRGSPGRRRRRGRAA